MVFVAGEILEDFATMAVEFRSLWLDGDNADQASPVNGFNLICKFLAFLWTCRLLAFSLTVMDGGLTTRWQLFDRALILADHFSVQALADSEAV